MPFLPPSHALRLPSRLPALPTRALSTSPSPLAPRRLPLASEHFPAKSPSAGPVVVLHGLYGSKQNWRGLGKAMALQLGRDVTTLVRLFPAAEGGGKVGCEADWGGG